MSDIFNRIKSGAGKVAKEADKAVDIKRIEIQVGSLNKQVDEEYQKLGKLVYESDLLLAENSDASSIKDVIRELKTQIEEKELEIAKIKEVEVSASVATSSGKRFCGECGTQNDANNKFCSSCGAKMS